MALDNEKVAFSEEQRKIIKDVERILKEDAMGVMLRHAERFCDTYEYSTDSRVYY